MVITLAVIGFILLQLGVMRRAQWWDERQRVLDRIEEDKETKTFWGFEESPYDVEEHKQKLAKFTNRKERLKHEAGCWAYHITALLVLLIAVLAYLSEDSTHTLHDVWEIIWWIVALFVGSMWLYFKIIRPWERMERELRWTKMMLRNAHNEAVSMRKASIGDYIELKTRIDDSASTVTM